MGHPLNLDGTNLLVIDASGDNLILDLSFTQFDAGISKSSTITLSNGGRTITASSTGNKGATSTHCKTKGKFYVEFDCTTMSSGSGVGILTNQINGGETNSTPVGFTYDSLATNAFRGAILYESGSIYVNTTSETGTGSVLSGSVGCLAIDLDNKKFWARTAGGNWNGSGTANPATNTGGYDISNFAPGAGVYLCAFLTGSGNVITMNLGNTAFSQTPPSGFGTWTAADDPEVTIDVGSELATFSTSASTCVPSVSSNGADRIIMLHIFNENTSGTLRTVSTVSGGSLTWALHKAFSWTDSTGNHNDLEIWWAHAATALSGSSITVTLSGSTDAFVVNSYAVAGANLTAPFDTNASIPGTASSVTGSATTGQVTGLTTSSSDPLVVASWANSTGGTNTTVGAEAGFALIAQVADHSAPVKWGQHMTEAQTPGAALSSTTVSTTPTHADWGMIVTALAPPSTGVTGTWASTEAADTFAASGFETGPPTGTWASTEADDTMSMSGTVPLAPPIIDATYGELTGGGFSLTSPATLTFSSTKKTAGGGEYMVAMFGYNLRGGTGINIASVSVTGLTFSHLYTITDTTSGAGANTIEVWGAPVSSAFNASGTNLTYTVIWQSGVEVDDVAYALYAVEGIFGLVGTEMFDANLSFPATAFNTTNTTPPTIVYSTTNASDLVIAASINTNPFGTNERPLTPAGWTQIANPTENNGLLGIGLTVSTKSFTTPQTSDNFTDGGTGNSVGWTGLVMAFTANAPPPITATMTLTEHTDTMSMTGGVLGGSWHSTEHPDIADFLGPVHGILAPTETPDAMAFTGTASAGTIFNPVGASAGLDFQNDNLTIVNSEAGGTPVGARSNTSYHGAQKLYVEFAVQLFGAQSGVGIGNASTTFAGWGGTEGSSPGPAQDGAGIFQNQNGTIWVDQVEQNNWAGISLNNAIVGVAIDLNANLIWFQTNGGHWNGITGANPATGVGGWDISALRTSPIFLYGVVFNAEDLITMNAGASAFTYSIPSGFVAWDPSTPLPNPLQLDGYATGSHSSPDFTPLTSATATLTTTKTDDVIVVAVATGGFWSASQVTSIVDTAGLTWHRRNRRWQNGGFKSNEPVNPDPPGIVVNQGLDIEIWWAHAPAALTGDVITVHVGGCGFISILAFGVSGANYTTPWDTHSQAGGYIDNIGNAFFPAMSELRTNATNSFLFGIHADNISSDAGVAQAPWTYVTSVLSTEHDGNAGFESLAYQLVEQPQTGTNCEFGYSYGGGTAFSAATVMFDSIVAAAETGTAEEIVWFWDSNSVNNFLQLTTGTTLTLNYSSTNFNLMVLVQVMIQSASGLGEVTSIGESQGLVTSAGFERRSRVVTATPHGTIAHEIWWAWMPMYATRAGNDTLTINTSGTASGDIIGANAFGLGGATGSFGLGDPFWDINGSLPAENSSNGPSPVPNATNISTTIPTTMLVAWTGNNSVPVPGFTDPYTTLIQAYPNTVQPIMQANSNAPNFYLGFEFMFTPTQVSDETAEFITSSPEPDGWIVIADAIPVGPPAPPVGVWASTETPDTFHGTGFVPVNAVWASIEHADQNTGAPAFAPYFGIGWIGALPAHGTMAAVETADHMGFYGWIVGFGCVGQMGAVESKDREAFSNRATVTGTWHSTEDKDRWASAGLVLPLKPLQPFIVKRRLLIIT